MVPSKENVTEGTDGRRQNEHSLARQVPTQDAEEIPKSRSSYKKQITGRDADRNRTSSQETDPPDGNQYPA